MSVADCGWGMIFARNAQEAGDFCLIARRSAEASQTPFFNVQDGFLTTHTVETALLPEPAFMKEFIGDPKTKLTNLMDPSTPLMSGVVQNQDSYMKGKIAQRWYYDRVGPALEESFDIFARKTGRKYGFVEAYRCEDAEYILVGMGCYMETAKVTADYLRKKGVKAGVLTVFVFRPFPGKHIVEALKNCAAFTIFERMDDPLSTTGNHLTREIKAAFCDAVTGQNGHAKIDHVPKIHHASAGLGSRDVRPGDIIAAFQNMMMPRGKEYFVVGIDHPLALKPAEDPDLRPRGGFSMRGHSVGGFGSVTTNKIIATIGGNVFGKDVQAYPKYGSEKKGLPTTYYLTIADSHIMMHSELQHVDLVCINDTTAILDPHTLGGLQQGGIIFMQSPYADPDEVWKRIPPQVRQIIRERKSGSATPTWCGSPAKWRRGPTCRCACRESCCWARSCG